MTNSHTSQLAEQAAQLLRTVAPVSTHPQAPALAREAARLLGAHAVAPAQPAPARESAFERQRAGMAQAKPPEPVAAWTKLRRLFGK
jgi:hypothetical protein